MNKVIGIDFGLYECRMAILCGKRPEIIEFPDGKRFIPAVVCIDAQGEYVVGKEVTPQTALSQQEAIVAVGQFLGGDFYDPVMQAAMQKASNRFIQGKNGKVNIWLGSRPHTPTEIVSLILKEMKFVAEEQIGEVTHAVIAVPTYFNQQQKDALYTAGEMVGLEVVNLISRPRVIALGHGIELKPGKPQTLLTYDWGSEGFNASVFSVVSGTFVDLAVSDNSSLENIDQMLVDYLLARIRQQHNINLTGNHEALWEIKRAAKQASIQLRQRQKISIVLPNLVNVNSRVIDVNLSLKREEYEATIRTQVNRTIELIYEALQAAKCTPQIISQVLLAGENTLTPLVVETLQYEFGPQKIKRGEKPSEYAALGAAVQTNFLIENLESRASHSTPPKPKHSKTKDKNNPKSVEQPEIECPHCGRPIPFNWSKCMYCEGIISGPGFVSMDALSKPPSIQTEGNKMEVVVEKGTPYSAKQPFLCHYRTTQAGQASIDITIYEGFKEKASLNEFLGIAHLDLPPDLPQATEVAITILIDGDSFINVTAQLPDQPDIVIHTQIDMTHHKLVTSASKKEPSDSKEHPVKHPTQPKPRQLTKHQGPLPVSTARMMLTCFINAGCLDKAERLIQNPKLVTDGNSLRYELGVAYAQQDKLDEATTQFKVLLKKRPNDPKAQEALLQVLQAQVGRHAARQEWEPAARLLNEAITIDPQNAKLQHYQTVIEEALPGFYTAQNRPDLAIQLWENTQLTQPTNYRVAHQLAITHHRWAIELEEKGDVKAANPHWHKAIANWVLLIEADAFWETWVASRQAVYGGAAIKAEDVSELRNKGLKARLEQIHRDFQTQNRNNTEQHKEYRVLLSLEVKTAQAMRQTADLLRQKQEKIPVPICAGPEMLAHLKLIDAARSMASRAAQLHPQAEAPKNLSIYLSPLGRLNLLIEERQTAQATLELKVVLQREPKNTAARALLVRAFKQEGEAQAMQDVEAAFTAWAEALSYDPGNAEVKKLIVTACKKAVESSPDFDEAIRLLNLGIRHVPDNQELKHTLATTLNRRGVQYHKKGDIDKAIADFEQALKLDPKDKTIQDNLAQTRASRHMHALIPVLAHVAVRDYDAALHEVNALLQRDPRHVEAQQLAGRIYRERGVERGNQGDWPGAINDLQQALRYQPQNTQFKKEIGFACNEYGVKLGNAASNLPSYDRAGRCRQLSEAEQILNLGLQYLPRDKMLTDNLTRVRLVKITSGC